MNRLLLLACLVCAFASSLCLAQGLADTLAGDGLVFRLDKSSATPAGTLEIGQQRYPWTAKFEGSQLVGTFTADGKAFTFTVQQTAVDEFLLESDGSRYRLKPAGAGPANLDQPNKPVVPNLINPNQPMRPPITPPANFPAALANLTFVPHTLTDPRTKLDVATLLVPEGWTVDPGIWWREKNAQFVTLATTVYDPKTGFGVRWVPSDQLCFSPVLYDNAIRQNAPPVSIGGYEYTRDLLDARGYLQKVVLPRYRNIKEMKVTAIEDLPRLAALIDASQPLLRQLYQQGGRQLVYTAARMTIEYPSTTGQPLEEQLLCVLNTSWSLTADANARAVGVQGERFYMLDRCYGIVAPKGQLAAAVATLSTVPLSMRPNREWVKFCDNINALVGKIALDQYAMEKAARAEITDSQRKTVEAASKAAERQSDEVGFLLNNSRAYKDPKNPNGPTHAAPGGSQPWQNGKGEIKNVPEGQNPNNDPGSTKDWTPLQPAGPKE